MFAGALVAACTNPMAKKETTSETKPGKAFVGINSISPSGGPLAGGTRIRILGIGFSVDSKVKIGTRDCTSVTFVSIDEVDCTVPGPNSTTESVDVVLTNPNDTSATLTSGFTYRPAPTITSVSPALGKSTGGTAITITGTGFVAGAQVNFGGSACNNVTVSSATQILCLTTAHAVGIASPTVTNVDSQYATLSNGYDYRLAPVITSISPNGGNITGGTTVTVTGTDFLSGITFSLGGSSCGSLNLLSSTSFTCVTTAHAAGLVDGVATNSNTMSHTKTGLFTYRSPPTVTAISPAVGALAGGTTVTMTGTGFVTGITPKIDGVACGSVNLVSATSLTCVTPGPHTQAKVGISVTNTDTQTASMSNAYDYMDPPAAPSTLTAAAVSETSVRINWNDNSNNEAEFRIERSTDGTTFTQITTVAADATTYLNTGLTTDQIYYYRVRAYNIAGLSAYTNVASATPIGIHLEVPIEMMDFGVTATASATSWLRTRTSLDTGDYDGTVTYRWEALCSNSSAGSLTLNLMNASDVSRATLAIPANSGVVTRYETTWTPTTGANDYRLRTPAVSSGSLICYNARILVQQANATITKIYIPLTAGAYSASDSDNTVTGLSIDETNSSTYGQQTPSQYSMWTKDTSKYADLAATNPWTFEALIASETSTVRASLYNRDTGLMVTGSEISQLTLTPDLYSISFANNAANFTNLNRFEARLRKSGGGTANIAHLYKAGLWVKLTNLNKAEVYYRNLRYISTSASIVVPHSRVHVDMSRFLNIVEPSVYHESVGYEPVVGTSDLRLRSSGTSDDSTTGTDFSSSSINFGVTGKAILRSGLITSVSDDRFIPNISVSSGTFQVNSSFIVIGITK